MVAVVEGASQAPVRHSIAAAAETAVRLIREVIAFFIMMVSPLVWCGVLVVW